MAGRQPLVAGNWKLNGDQASVSALAAAVRDGAGNAACEVLVCPVAVHIAEVANVLQGQDKVALGAQNCAEQASGAFTGEVAAPMLAEYGVSYIIVGHSERRQLFGESSALVAKKAQAVLAAGVTPILCIGETLEERDGGMLATVLDEQLDPVIEQLGIAAFAQLVVAYEPVWAIGTGRSASSEQAQEVHAMIRSKLAALDGDVAGKTRILYGGSVKPDNAKALFSQDDIDGGLIGGAALDAESFLAICNAA